MIKPWVRHFARPKMLVKYLFLNGLFQEGIKYALISLHNMIR